MLWIPSTDRADVARHAALMLLLAVAAIGCTTAPAPAPVAADPAFRHPAAKGFVSSAHPLATQAGLDVLRRGGSAIDAAIAVQAMLGLVEPQSSGLAGGAILLHYDAATRRIDSYVGRERAPASAGPAMFTDDAGKSLTSAQAMLSGRATGVPGCCRRWRWRIATTDGWLGQACSMPRPCAPTRAYRSRRACTGTSTARFRRRPRRTW